MTQELIQLLSDRGYQARVVNIERLNELKTEIESRYTEGLINEIIYKRLKPVFEFNPPGSMPNAQSLIVVAVLQPHFRFIFEIDGKQIPLIVPPTYLYNLEVDKEVENLLMDILSPKGYRVVRAIVPRKLLAVRSGLADYGRNNIAYVEGMGSFNRLTTFFSDLPCEQEEWREMAMMEQCEDCVACIRACPTAAIAKKDFLVHVEKCVTFHNEEPGDIPFPLWLESSFHDLLIGCLRCQEICPANEGIDVWIETGAEFTADETELLLNGTTPDLLSKTTLDKLEKSGLIEILDVIPRNLKVLLERI